MAEVGAGHLAPRFGLEEGGGDGVGGEEGGEEEAGGTSADYYDWVIGGGAGRIDIGVDHRHSSTLGAAVEGR